MPLVRLTKLRVEGGKCSGNVKLAKQHLTGRDNLQVGKIFSERTSGIEEALACLEEKSSVSEKT